MFWAFASVAFAQELPSGFPPAGGLLDQLGANSGQAGGDVSFTAEFRVLPGTDEGQLSVTALLAPTWHIYSVTQPAGGTQRTEISVIGPPGVEIVGPFQPDTPPTIKHYEYYPVPIEEHSEQVTWTAPIRITRATAPPRIVVHVRGQICTEAGTCIPIDRPNIIAKPAGTLDRESAAEPFRSPRGYVTISGQVAPGVVVPGGKVEVTLAVQPDQGWHVYQWLPKDDPELTNKPTLIDIVSPAGWPVGVPVTNSPLVTHESPVSDQPVRYYEGSVTWTLEVDVPQGTEPGDYALIGSLAYQSCTDTGCAPPAAVTFFVSLRVGDQETPGRVPLRFVEEKYNVVSERLAGAAPADGGPSGERAEEGSVSESVASPAREHVLDLSQLEQSEPRGSSTPLGLALITAFAAGFILNFMPCVLPVIGLKIMAFVQQAGDSRGRVFLLNLWYTFGMISVFLVLASLAVFLGMSWGQQFSSATFNVVLTAVVFVFGLSFLGVWEIPIPGFVGTGKVQGLGEKEGATGAFAKGVLTTILATPCSGPLLTPALTWAVSQTPLVTYTTFAFVGLGMASPYLLIGAFPRLVGFLPKPGAWMDTFKHIMGFVLLGTVVFLLSFMPVPYVVPTVAFLIGLWMAFWWIGRTPITEPFQVKLRAWLAGAIIAVLTGAVSFGWLLDVMEARFQRAVQREVARTQTIDSPVPPPENREDELPFQPFSLDRLNELVAQGHTVFVDFTADW